MKSIYKNHEILTSLRYAMFLRMTIYQYIQMRKNIFLTMKIAVFQIYTL
jgi:hypothetical protein